MAPSEQNEDLMSTPKAHSCPYLGHCRGCHFPFTQYPDQLEYKTSLLRDLFQSKQLAHPEIQVLSAGALHLRHRFDFTIEETRMGLYDETQHILDLKTCEQLSPELLQCFLEFRTVKFPIRKGSVRLRVGPGGQKGVWLDFANLDIKNLLENPTPLANLMQKNFIIEVGQKGKSVSFVNGLFKLSDPVPLSWFQAKLANNNYVTLGGLVSNFTQPSWKTAELMTDVCLDWLRSVQPRGPIAEFGAGLGQFTLPVLSLGFPVDVFEVHQGSAGYLKLNAQNHGLQDGLNIYIGDFQNKALEAGKNYELALVNPPRSGLKGFATEILKSNPNYVIYISCFPESLIDDLTVFLNQGYSVKEVRLVDQFPQTKHFETCVLIEKN